MSKSTEPPKALKPIVFRSLEEVRSFVPDKDAALLDSSVLEKGKVTVVGGKGGVGKSMLAMSLAIAGLKRRGDEEEWMGYNVLRPFRTLVIQTENGRKRLKYDIEGLDIAGAARNILVSDPPERGLRFDDEQFCECVRETIARDRIDLVIIDPWSAVIGSHGFDALRKAMTLIREVIGYGEKAPALLILAHTRKSKIRATNFRATSIDELTGSQALGTDARCVFLLERLTEDLNKDSVVFACVKNNDGICSSPSVWIRKPVMFEPVRGLDPEQVSSQKSESETRKCRVVEILKQEQRALTSEELFVKMGADERKKKNCILASVKVLVDEGILEKAKGERKSILVSLKEGADTTRYLNPENTSESSDRSCGVAKEESPNERSPQVGSYKINGETVTEFPLRPLFISGRDLIENAKRCRGLA